MKLHFTKVILLIPILVTFFPGCGSNKGLSESQTREEIQSQLDKCVKAIKTKDIELYMDLIPEGFVVYDESGETISRERQREYTIRDWQIIESTLSNKYSADSIRLSGDSAIVYTSQRWKRLMFQSDGKTIDTVLTTQKHIETWRKTKKGWMNFAVKELGGQVYVNGIAYQNCKLNCPINYETTISHRTGIYPMHRYNRL